MKLSPFVKTFGALFLFIGVALYMQAQGRQMPTPEEREARLTEIIRELKLNDEQAVSFREIETNFEKKIGKVFMEGGDRNQAREKMKALRDERNKELKGVLTVDQFQALQKIQREEMRRRSGGRQGGTRN